MSASDKIGELYPSLAAANTLAGAAAVMRRLAGAVGADRYLLLEAPREHSVGRSRIIASDWPRDAIEIIGIEAIARLVLPDLPHGVKSGSLEARRIDSEELALRLGPDPAAELAGFGFAEFVSGRISAGLSRGAVIFASRSDRSIDLDLMPDARMLCSYLWSNLNGDPGRPATPDPLSERERECLLWVSEGKTTDEVALILDVSSNTVNRYILHATQKLSAASRVMTIAVAIRSGLI